MTELRLMDSVVVEDLQQEIERLRVAYDLAQEAAKMALRTGVINDEFRQRVLTMLDQARVALKTPAPPKD